MKKVLMSMAVVAAMIAFAACGNNTKKADEKAAEATEQCCKEECDKKDECCKEQECCKEGCCKEECDKKDECCKEQGCCKEQECAECKECADCPDCPAAESEK